MKEKVDFFIKYVVFGIVFVEDGNQRELARDLSSITEPVQVIEVELVFRVSTLIHVDDQIPAVIGDIARS